MSLPSAEKLVDLSAQTALRVAVADDDRSMRELVVHMLDKQGHKVVAVADSGQALVEQCAGAQPDVIITDNLMPGLDGTDAAAIIYAQRPTPIILLSGYCDRNLVLDAERKHVLIYLVKPISDDNLRSALDRCRALLDSSQGAEEPEGETSGESRSTEISGRSPPTPP